MLDSSSQYLQHIQPKKNLGLAGQRGKRMSLARVQLISKCTGNRPDATYYRDCVTHSSALKELLTLGRQVQPNMTEEL